MSEVKKGFQVSGQVRENIRRGIWPVSLAVAVIGLGVSGLPPLAKALAVLSVAGWGWLGRRAGMLAPVLAVMLVAMGRVSPFPQQTALLGAIVLGQAALILRILRRGPWEAAAAGLLWAGMAFAVPGLLPLAVLGLLALGAMHEDHGRMVVYTGWGLLLAGLALFLLRGGLPGEWARPSNPDTYGDLAALFRELFTREALWTFLPLVGLLDFAQPYPSDGRKLRRNLPILGGLLCLIFLPAETLRGGLFTLGLPLSAVLLTRWLLAMPWLRECCASKLKPASHPLPGNFWLTALTTILAGVFLWVGWTTGRERFLSGEPVTPMEQRLVNGEGGHPLSGALLQVSDWAEMPPLFWNRLVSGFFLVMCAAMLVRILNRSAGMPLALASGILFLGVPGLAIRLSTAEGGALPLFFFLKAFSSLSKDNAQRSWLRGGMYAGLTFWLHPVWLFPCLGLLAGVFEVNRARMERMLIGFGISAVGGLAFMIAVQPVWLANLLPGAMPEAVRLEGVGNLLWTRHLFLMLSWVAILVLGSNRRGTGWWCVAMSVIPFAFANRIGVDPAVGFIPLTVMSCIAFVRLPMMLDVRHPSPYQSVLICQLLLWLPALLGYQDLLLFLQAGF